MKDALNSTLNHREPGAAILNDGHNDEWCRNKRLIERDNDAREIISGKMYRNERETER
jgi:hypothetical protein